MLNKTKKVAFLTTGLAGALVVSSAVGVALSSCTTTSSTTTPNKFTYSIDWTDQDQLSQLTIDEQGLVYSSADKTEIITVAPNTAATSFVIPASVKYITGYNQITKNSDGTIASSVSYGAFQNQTSLISVSFASDSTLVSIGDSAFYGCTFLSTINLPSSTSVVYNNAFANCTNLRSVNLVGVSYIGTSAFAGAMVNGAQVSIDLSGASYIGDNAFNGCTSLASVDFTNNTKLTYIGKSAFAGALVSGSTTTTINLANATLLKTISDSAFSGCTNLASVVLPTSGALTTIGASAFSGASSLTQVGATANTFTAPSTLGNYATSTTGTGTDAVTYVSSGIGANAFTGTKIATVDLSAVTTTTPLGAAAFKGMTSLATINFGTSSKITTIPYSLFEGDTALTELTLPASITSIADGSSNSSTNTANTNSPFYGTGLVTINMNGITSYATGNLTLAGTSVDATTVVPYGLFQGITTLKTVYLKAGTTGINTNAFDGTTALTTVKEGSTVTNTTNGDGFLIPATLEWTGYYAFQGSGIKSVAFANAADSSSNTNKLWYLGQGTFASTPSLTTVDLSKADTTTEHTIPAADSGTGTTAVTGNGLFAISSSLFASAAALTTVTLPTSVTTIYSDAFTGNTALSTVNFAELTALSSIQSSNFTGAAALASIDLSKTAMQSAAFNVATIFTGLPTNATINLPATATTLAASSFLIGNATTASQTARAALTYSSGVNLTITSGTTAILGTASATYYYLGSGSSSTTTSPNPILQYASGDLDLTASTDGATSNVISGTQIGRYYGFSFFGNTKLTGLTLSASNLVLQGTTATPTQATTLFMSRSSAAGTASDYAYGIVPFGQNTALKTFTFTGFDVNSSPTYPTVSGTTYTDNPLYKTTTKTWAQVATIINKFAGNSVTALTAWPTVTDNNIDSNSSINNDSTLTGGQGTVTSGSGANNTNYILSVTNSVAPNAAGTGPGTTTATGTISVPNSMPKATTANPNTDVSTSVFYHNGVKWTLTVYSANHATNPGAVTLVGENVNIYKATNDRAIVANQTPFGSTITVTLNIVPSTSSSSN